MSIEVQVAGRGRVRDGQETIDTDQTVKCSLCDKPTDVVVSLTPDGTGSFGCRDCLRARLEATTVAVYLLAESSGLPWGKISG